MLLLSPICGELKDAPPAPMIIVALATSPRLYGCLYAARVAPGSEPDELNSWVSSHKFRWRQFPALVAIFAASGGHDTYCTDPSKEPLVTPGVCVNHSEFKVEKEQIVLHTKRNMHPGWTHSPYPVVPPKAPWRFGIPVTVALVFLATAVVVSAAVISRNENALRGGINSFAPKPGDQQSINPSSIAAQDPLMAFYAQDLYLTEHAGADGGGSSLVISSATMNSLLQALRQGQPRDQRDVAVAALVQAPLAVTPVLLDALADSDAGVRRSAAQILGARRAPEAEDALFFATSDPDPSVRTASITALGQTGSPFALPRLRWLQLTETDPAAQLAARLAERSVYTGVAATLGVPLGDLRQVAVASSNQRTYAATSADLYTPNGLEWQRVGSLPDVPSALVAAGLDGQLLYLGTASAGVFRSSDGGSSWHAVDRGLPAAVGFTVTAVAANPDDARHVYIALAANAGMTLLPLMPFGLFESTDGGDTWKPVAEWKMDNITTRLAVDSTQPMRLLGLTESGVWEYPLPTP